MDKLLPTRQPTNNITQTSQIRPTQDSKGPQPPIAPVRGNGPEPPRPESVIIRKCPCGCGADIEVPVNTSRKEQPDGKAKPAPLPKPVDPNQPQKNMNQTAPQPTGKENKNSNQVNNQPTVAKHAEPAPTGTIKSSNTPPMPTTTPTGQNNGTTGGLFTQILAQDLQQAAQHAQSGKTAPTQENKPSSLNQPTSNGSPAQPSTATTNQSAANGSLAQSSSPHNGQTASNGSPVQPSTTTTNQSAANRSLAQPSTATISPPSTLASNLTQLSQQLPVNLSNLSNLQGTPQNAKVALALSNTLVQMPTNVAMPVATAINQLPPQTLGKFFKFFNGTS